MDVASLSETLRKAGFGIREAGVTDFSAYPSAYYRTKTLPVRLLRSAALRPMHRTPYLYCVVARECDLRSSSF